MVESLLVTEAIVIVPLFQFGCVKVERKQSVGCTSASRHNCERSGSRTASHYRPNCTFGGRVNDSRTSKRVGSRARAPRSGCDPSRSSQHHYLPSRSKCMSCMWLTHCMMMMFLISSPSRRDETGGGRRMSHNRSAALGRERKGLNMVVPKQQQQRVQQDLWKEQAKAEPDPETLSQSSGLSCSRHQQQPGRCPQAPHSLSKDLSFAATQQRRRGCLG